LGSFGVRVNTLSRKARYYSDPKSLDGRGITINGLVSKYANNKLLEILLPKAGCKITLRKYISIINRYWKRGKLPPSPGLRPGTERKS